MFAYFLLGEKFTLFDISCCLLNFGGALLIIKPGWLTGIPSENEYELYGKILAIIASICGGLVPVVVRSLKGNYNVFEIA